MAENLDEVSVAVKHYWGLNACKLGSSPAVCPLCRAQHQEMAAMMPMPVGKGFIIRSEKVIKVNYMLTPEQRDSGYSAEFDGDFIRLYYNGAEVDIFTISTGGILHLRQVVQNHMEMLACQSSGGTTSRQKSGVEFGKQ